MKAGVWTVNLYKTRAVRPAACDFQCRWDCLFECYGQARARRAKTFNEIVREEMLCINVIYYNGFLASQKYVAVQNAAIAKNNTKNSDADCNAAMT